MQHALVFAEPSLNMRKGGTMYVRKRYLIFGLLLFLALMALNCAPGNDRWDQEINPGAKAGFWIGIWHGLIIIITFIISLFASNVGIYEVSNTGWSYNLGFLIGLFCSVGGGLHIRRHRRKRKWREKDLDWDEIAAKVEERVRKGIRGWLEETEQGERAKEWEEIGEKIEKKIKEALRKWAEKE